MSRVPLACVLACLWLVPDGRPAFAQWEKQAESQSPRKMVGDGDPGRSSWEEYRERLGHGPVYQVEALHRPYETGILYYCRALISRDAPAPIMQGFGIDRDGKCVPPPKPGLEADRARVVGEGKTALPLALPTGLVGVWLERTRAGNEELHTGVSCLVTTMRLPEKAGQVETAFHQGLFRVERLTAAQVARAQPLRQDAAFFRDRVAAIQKEVVAAHRARPLRLEHELAEAAALFREPAFVEAVRAGLARWIERTPAEVAGKGFPNSLAFALAQCGEAKDFQLFHRLVRRHPAHASYVTFDTLVLMRRVGGAQAVPLVADLLKDASPSEAVQPAEELVRRLDATVPRPTHADGFLKAMTSLFHLDPADFGLRMAESRLLELADRHPFPPPELELLRLRVKNNSGTWTMLAEADRKPGYAAALKWVAGRKGEEPGGRP